MNLRANDTLLSQETPAGLPSHDKRQYLHLQLHGTQRFCTMIDVVFISFFIILFLAIINKEQIKSEGPHQSAHPASICRKPTLFSIAASKGSF